jgi:hypothetical protein
VRTSQRVLTENSFRVILEGAMLEAKPDLLFLVSWASICWLARPRAWTARRTIWIYRTTE